MARGKTENTEVETTLREGVDVSQNLPFEHIIAKYGHQYDFCVINDAKQSVQRHEMAGWKVWKGEKLFDTEFEQASSASQTRDGFTSVPCGIAGDGKPTRAYLMYAPKGHADSIVAKRHAENRQRKQAYGAKAKQNAQKGVGAVETYTPNGFGVDGMKHLNNTQG